MERMLLSGGEGPRIVAGQDERARFPWTAFYEAVGRKLLGYAEDRKPLVEALHRIASRVKGLNHLNDHFPDGRSGPLQDICPFTVFGTFNRGLTDENRQTIAGELGRFLGVAEPAPSSFAGIPLLNNQKSWFFNYALLRKPDDIDRLWEVFVAAASLVAAWKGAAGSAGDEGVMQAGAIQPAAAVAAPERHVVDDVMRSARGVFIRAYDEATKVWGTAWNLTTGLFWAYPWDFPTLERHSRLYVRERLGLKELNPGKTTPCDGTTYLGLRDQLAARFPEESYPVHSFPALSLEAGRYHSVLVQGTAVARTLEPFMSDGEPTQAHGMENAGELEGEAGSDETVQLPAAAIPYSVQDILKDGCFLDMAAVGRMMKRLYDRKNLILQGPPGTGKTWLARRLAFALMGQKDEGRVRAVQFHPNLSYEDFVRGWRPAGDGRLKLADGVFMEAIAAALKQPAVPFVVLIEEINRGNPAQIFGELLTLIEASKRSPSEALELGYPDVDGNRQLVYVPENLYVIGTMNLADRSLALVDLALRRRFAFVDLEPKLGEAWHRWVVDRCGVDARLAVDIRQRMDAVNQRIGDDPRLGRQFLIGHSYVTPSRRLGMATGDGGEAHDTEALTKAWFRDVVDTEIRPLLEEYWFDAPGEAEEAVQKLLQGW